MEAIAICASGALLEGGDVVPFEVVHLGQPVRAFVGRFEGMPVAYLNRCTHVAMELDWQPNRIFDDTGQWLLCASHGAVYDPASGDCVGGPCQGGLIKLQVSEHAGQVWWQPDHHTVPAKLS